MAGNARYELNSASPEMGFAGNYPNGQRGSYSSQNLDRSGSFKEVMDSRMFGSGSGTSRGSGAIAGDLPSLSQWLMLDPIILGDQKYTRSGELRRVLGISVGTTSEENSFGATHLKGSPPVAIEELKRFRASVLETCIRARGRTKRLEDLLHKLNKYYEVASKKQQRVELLSNDRSGGSNLKMGIQIQRNSPDPFTQKLEERTKSIALSKRVRTSVAETRAESRGNGLARLPVAMTKDRDMLKDNGADSDLIEEKIRRLPAGGEGWDKKMKRKRSVGTAFTRSVDGEAEPKRAMHHKLSGEASLQSSDVHSFRSGGSSVTGGVNKLDATSLPSNSNARSTPKNEQEKAPLSRDLAAGLSRERPLVKGCNKLSNREDNPMIYPSQVTKGKASRTPRNGSMPTTNSVPNLPRSSVTLETWEQPPGGNKVPSFGGANNRKRAMPSGSSSPPMAQWVGQRPQKISRTRRANLVSPVSNHDETQTSSEGCSPSEFGVRSNSTGTNGSLLSRATTNGSQHIKVKVENGSSPARISESDESGAVENRMKDKGIGIGEMEGKIVNGVQSIEASALNTKRNKLNMKEAISDGVQRQGRSGRGSSFSRTSISPVSEKMDNASSSKPIRATRPASDKSGSKSGRPSKKVSDRKGSSRLGQMPNIGSPDSNGESDDDREELLAAANFARNANHLRCCSSPFWNEVEPIFSSVSLEDTSYVSQQLNHAVEIHNSLPQTFAHHNKSLGDLGREIISAPDLSSGERNICKQNHVGSEEMTNTTKLASRSNVTTLFGSAVSESSPLYERILSALIVEDDIDGNQENSVGGNIAFQNVTESLNYDAFFLVDAEPRKKDGAEVECESGFGVHAQTYGTTGRSFLCNGNSSISKTSCPKDTKCNGEVVRGGNGYVHSENGALAISVDWQYENLCLDDKLLLELQSIGICLEPVPALDDKEDEVINQEIEQLKMDLCQQIKKKKTGLDKMHISIQDSQTEERRTREEVAMNHLAEQAYRKLLATRGGNASRSGVAKVPKQVALAFAKRTLARCRKFEESGTSCFSEPPFRDITFAPPPKIIESEPLTPAVSNGSIPGGSEPLTHQVDQPLARNGPISNRGKRKEVLLDDVVGFRGQSSLGSTLSGGTKGKRSERDRDKDTSTRNGIAKGSRQSLGNIKGDRKTKAKPKQKTAQISTSGNGFVSKFSSSGSGELGSSNGNRNRETGMVSPGNIPFKDPTMKDSLEFTGFHLNDLDQIEDLGVGTELGGAQDLSTWLNFDDDCLQDLGGGGLDIPMDDISELNMF